MDSSTGKPLNLSEIPFCKKLQMNTEKKAQTVPSHSYIDEHSLCNTLSISPIEGSSDCLVSCSVSIIEEHSLLQTSFVITSIHNKLELKC